jgi:hypothetical protein
MTTRIIAVALALAFGFLAFGTSTGDAAGGRTLSTDLNGEEEISPVTGLPDAGDLDGTGTATVTFNRGLGEVCFDVSVEGIELPVTMAHIHGAPAGTNGPIVVGFIMTPDDDGDFSGCVLADRELVKEITKNPSDFYVNVHNGEFPGGALRGQLGD